jgi:stage II sporulation protein R
MRKRTYLSVFVIMSILGVSLLYIFLSAKETFVPGIPDEAIRLRIIANSDQLEDQVVKQKVRDAIVKEMNTWVKKPKSIKEARACVEKHLPQFQSLAEDTVKQYGYTYPVKVDFKEVPFPTKLYGNQVYPAGNYEALRVTLGSGEGGNWWCVLFPPLCFVDMSNGDAVPQNTHISKSEEGHVYAASKVDEEEEEEEQLDQAKKNREEGDQNKSNQKVLENETKKVVQVRFLFVDKLKELFLR